MRVGTGRAGNFVGPFSADLGAAVRQRASATGELHGHARPYATARSCTPCSARAYAEKNSSSSTCTRSPNAPGALRAAKKAKISGVRGKGGTTRTVFLGADDRSALADYLEHERPSDAGPAAAALFLSAASIGSRRPAMPPDYGRQ